jgi:hypothetical protein
MADDLVPLEYVCARWAYSELLSNQPYHGSELKPLREKLARGVSFDDLDALERALLLRKWREVRGVPAFIKRLRGITALQCQKRTLGLLEHIGTNVAARTSRYVNLWGHSADNNTHHRVTCAVVYLSGINGAAGKPNSSGITVSSGSRRHLPSGAPVKSHGHALTILREGAPYKLLTSFAI